MREPVPSVVAYLHAVCVSNCDAVRRGTLVVWRGSSCGSRDATIPYGDRDSPHSEVVSGAAAAATVGEAPG